MASQFDLVIRNGTIVDGNGGAPFVGDVGIRGDIIAAVGKVNGTGAQEIDAKGKLVTPGFVDIHTHYDGQAIWEERLSPSSGHGVTTVAMGNCGVGFAPCKSDDRERLVRLMEGVEDIPGVVMTEGLTWEWETYPQYLNAVEKRAHDINMVSYLPHSALRVYVMGERAAAGETATPQDLKRMAELTREAIRAGAIGFSTSRTLFHRSSAGELVPTLDAGAEELRTIAGAMNEAGSGILQVANDYKDMTDVDGEFAMVKEVARATNRPLTLPMAQMHSSPETWRKIIGLIEQANAEGIEVTAQVLPRAIGMMYGLDLSMHPFMLVPAYQEIEHLPVEERIARMKNPQVRARILADTPGTPSVPTMGYIRIFENMFEATDPLDYEPSPEMSIAARAARMGVTPAELAYDVMVEHGRRAAFFMPFANYAYGNLDAVMELFKHKDVVPGLGDGGAHYGMICDASYSTFLITHWTRDRDRGERLTVPRVIKALAHDTAAMIGLHDRGVLAPGYKADVNIIDYDRLSLHAPQIKFDLPAGGRRLTQRADGYDATIVNGKVVYRDGQPTGALPGRLVRGPQSAPAMQKAAVNA